MCATCSSRPGCRGHVGDGCNMCAARQVCPVIEYMCCGVYRQAVRRARCDTDGASFAAASGLGHAGCDTLSVWQDHDDGYMCAVLRSRDLADAGNRTGSAGSMRGCVNVCVVQSVCDGFDAGRCMVSVGVALGVVGRCVASGAYVVLGICVCGTHMCGAAHTGRSARTMCGALRT